jgi:hypothetical protein
LLALAAAIALSGCNGTLDGGAGSPAGGTAGATNAPSSTPVAIAAAPADPAPSMAAAPAAVPAPAPLSATTFVGRKVEQLRSELTQFQGNVAVHQQELGAARDSASSNASAYFGTVAQINTRLQAGTTPGNPELVADWSRAQSMLDRMNSDVAKLNTIANEAASDSSFGNYVLNDIRSAYSLQGGVERDRAQLHDLENQTLASLTSVDQLLNNLSQEISRQSSYVTNERNNLVTLALAIQNGQLYGPSLANRTFATTPAPSVAGATALRQNTKPASARGARGKPVERPLVVIRFDQPDVPYQQPLYTAISRALERKPGATFTVMAVAPNAGSPAQVAVNTNASRQNAENVLRALTNMGLPANRVSLSATMSPDIQTNEVRVFVR